MADPDTYVRFRLRGTVRVSARVLESGDGWAIVEVVGSRERVRLDGSAWSEAKAAARTDET